VSTKIAIREAAMAELVLRDVTKIFKGGVVALDRVNLTIHDGEFVVFVGPSGCGKSTLLRLVAGLEELTSGTIEIDGRVVDLDPPRDRDVAMVFQNYALYPHYTVAQNIGFSLRMRRYPKRDALRMDLTVAYFFDPHTDLAIPAESPAPALAS
jgi:ABC-type sugar transport system ATPase subunit